MKIDGALRRGVSKEAAEKIFDEMMDFASYAFNKAHAACYAVVAYQTAYLKYYYPVEFLAALMTSVIDNPKKVSEYILTCRNMGIELLPPDISEGEAGFSVSDGRIRYALTAIKNVGRPIIDSIVQERAERGRFTNLKDFITRMADKDVNKRAIENFIKAGALDSLGGTRKQFMSVYVQIADHIAHDKKNNLAGQISLFDIASGDDKDDFDIRMPEVGEYSKEMMLSFEKEVLGIYVSGHPMEEYQELWQKFITNTTTDFMLDEESGQVSVTDKKTVVVGGMIADKTVKYTKNDKVMAFLNLEDLVGNVEVVVFPGDYEKYGSMLLEDAKIFIQGRASVEEDKDAKVICEQIMSFDEAAQVQGEKLFQNRYGSRSGGGYRQHSWQSGQTQQGQQNWQAQNGQLGGQAQNGQQGGQPQNRQRISKLPDGIWIQFADAASYKSREKELLESIADSDGTDNVVIFLKNTKEVKVLPPNLKVCADKDR